MSNNLSEKLIRTLPDNILINIATFGKIGFTTKKHLSLFNSPTLASALGVIFYSLFLYQANLFIYLLIISLFIYFGGIICDEASKRMNIDDPKEIVLDEFIGAMIVFIGTQKTIEALGSHAWILFIIGFLVFRLIDWKKPSPIHKLEKLPTWGILADDLGAGIASCIILQLSSPILLNMLA